MSALTGAGASLWASGSHVCMGADRKSTRLNSSHGYISYAVFCLKKKKAENAQRFHSDRMSFRHFANIHLSLVRHVVYRMKSIWTLSLHGGQTTREFTTARRIRCV